jgi:uncharacterized protein
MTSTGFADLTGNDYVSIPDIAAADGGLDGINVLHSGLAGLVEWMGDGNGTPLFRAVVRAGDSWTPLSDLRWRRLDRWIPTFTAALPGDITLTGTVCAPAGYPTARGFILRLELVHGGRAPVDVAVGLEICWAWSNHWIATGRALAGANRMSFGAGGQVTLETDQGRGPALCILPGHAADVELPGGRTIASGQKDAVVAENGTPLRARLGVHVTLTPHRRTSVTFFIGAGRECDGAHAAARALRRAGPDALIRQARLELSHTLRAGQDHRWADTLNRNLLFNRFFAVGRAIDDDQLYVLRSRSTRCPAPAIFNEREALFWTLPALVLADPGLAREALFRALDTFSERCGEHQRYIDGGAYDSAFSLDQCLLYPWAIDHYMTAAGDAAVIDEPLVQQVVAELDTGLYMRLHPEHMLCSGDVLPSGDAADHPYQTLGNVMLHAFALTLPRLWPRNAGSGETPPRFEGTGPEIAAAVWQHCVTDVGGEHILTSSADLAGGAAIYDDPEASLSLLPFFGFCEPDDPVWMATMEFLRSRRYPLWRDGAVPGVSSRDARSRCRLAALVADALTNDPAILDRLLRVKLPAGVAAAAYDCESGEAAEPHHAALAGFLAWTLVRVAEPPEPARTKRKRRG